MALEDVEWRERYGDQTYKARSLDAIRAVFFAITFSQAVILPSLPAFLIALHSRPSMVGYCLSAQCLGELCTSQFFSFWYDRRPAREVILFALFVNAMASLAYASSPHRLAVLASRFFVGCAFGVREMLMTMVGGFTHQENRLHVLNSVRSTQIAALILGLGLAAVATFWHMPAPRPFGGLHHKFPSYVNALGNSTFANVRNQSFSIWKLFDEGKSTSWGLIENSHSYPGRRILAQDAVPEIESSTSVGDAVGKLLDNAELGDVLNPGPANSSSQDSGEASEVDAGGDKTEAESDQEIGNEMGSKGLYIPSYLTAVVGHGLKAPGYLGALVSFGAGCYVWRGIEEGPRKILTQRVPLSHLSPSALAYFTPLMACVGLEGVSQLCYVVLETVVASLIRIRAAWPVDAVAVAMLFIAACGVVGIAVVEHLKPRYTMRQLLLLCIGMVCLGSFYCLPWNQWPSVLQLIIGSGIMSAGFFPLSALASQVFTMGVVKIYSDQGEMVWLQLFWSLTSSPPRVLGPVLLCFALEMDPSGGICFAAVLLSSLLAASLLLYFQSALITPQVEEEAQALPGIAAAVSAPTRMSPPR